jgi:hypothetical protein
MLSVWKGKLPDGSPHPYLVSEIYTRDFAEVNRNSLDSC